MNNYNVYIQDKKVDTIEAKNTGHALAIVGKKLKEGVYSFDETKEANLKVEPVN